MYREGKKVLTTAFMSLVLPFSLVFKVEGQINTLLKKARKCENANVSYILFQTKNMIAGHLFGSPRELKNGMIHNGTQLSTCTEVFC